MSKTLTFTNRDLKIISDALVDLNRKIKMAIKLESTLTHTQGVNIYEYEKHVDRLQKIIDGSILREGE